MDYSEQKRLIAKIMAEHPIAPDKVYPVDREAEEQAVVRKWLRASATRSSAAPAAVSAEVICNLIADVMSPIVADLQRQLSESGKRALLNEQRCKSLEVRCARAEERLAKIETRALGPIDGLASPSPRPRAH